MTNQHSENLDSIIALFALITSIVSILYTVKSLRIQRDHNYKSVKPIASIDLGDYETDIFIRISNNGIGPMVIKSVHVSNGSLSGSSIIDLLPESIKLNTVWNTFTAKIENESIKVDHSVYLLQKKFPTDNSITPEIDRLKQALRESLMSMHIKIIYTDIYEVGEFTVEKDLDWFGRTLRSRNAISSQDYTI